MQYAPNSGLKNKLSSLFWILCFSKIKELSGNKKMVPVNKKTKF